MKSRKSNYKFILGIAVAVLLPLSLYFITRQFTDGHVKLPRYYIAEGVDSMQKDGKMVYDTQYHHVADLMLTNQLGQQVSLNKDLE